MLQHFSKFFDKFHFEYPQDASFSMAFNQSNLRIPSFAIKSFAILGASAFLYFSFKCVTKAFSYIWKFIQTRIGGLKTIEKDNENIYAVVYGACSPLGKHIARYLMEHEYSLLLIDNQQKELDNAVEEIQSTKHSKYTQCETLSYNFEYSYENMANKIRDVFSHCQQIKIFINCKSTFDETVKLTKFHTEQDDKLSSVLSNAVKGGIIIARRVLANMFKHKEGMMLYICDDKEARSNVLSAAVHSCIKTCMGGLKQQYGRDGIRFINVEYNKDGLKSADYIKKLFSRAFRYIGVYNEVKI